LDRVAWLRSIGGRRVIERSGPQWIIDCPWCSKRGHLYVAEKTGEWICFRCEEKGKFLRLFARVEGYGEDTGAAARALMASIRRGDAPPPPMPDEAAPDQGPPDVGPPEEFEPVYDGRWHWPPYLAERGMRPDTARAFGLGFCRSGRYANRIVIPVACPDGRSFTTRLIVPGEPRYLGGPRVGRLLHGWPQATAIGGEVVTIVEGPFDAFACYQAGVPALAMMGKRLREAQVPIVRRGGWRRFVLLIDAQATARKAALETATSGALGDDVRIAVVAGYKDAGEAMRRGRSDAVRAAVERAIPHREAALIDSDFGKLTS
jgi:hypothetical protein